MLLFPSSRHFLERIPEECSHHRPINRLPFDGIAGVTENGQEQDGSNEDHCETDPVIRLGVPILHANEFRREVCTHQANWQEQNGCLGQQDSDPSELLNSLRVLERNQVEILGHVSRDSPNKDREKHLPGTLGTLSH